MTLGWWRGFSSATLTISSPSSQRAMSISWMTVSVSVWRVAKVLGTEGLRWMQWITSGVADGAVVERALEATVLGVDSGA